jgi:hypothetical protein
MAKNSGKGGNKGGSGRPSGSSTNKAGKGQGKAIVASPAGKITVKAPNPINPSGEPVKIKVTGAPLHRQDVELVQKVIPGASRAKVEQSFKKTETIVENVPKAPRAKPAKPAPGGNGQGPSISIPPGSGFVINKPLTTGQVKPMTPAPNTRSGSKPALPARVVAPAKPASVLVGNNGHGSGKAGARITQGTQKTSTNPGQTSRGSSKTAPPMPASKSKGSAKGKIDQRAVKRAEGDLKQDQAVLQNRLTPGKGQEVSPGELWGLKAQVEAQEAYVQALKNGEKVSKPDLMKAFDEGHEKYFQQNIAPLKNEAPPKLDHGMIMRADREMNGAVHIKNPKQREQAFRNREKILQAKREYMFNPTPSNKSALEAMLPRERVPPSEAEKQAWLDAEARERKGVAEHKQKRTELDSYRAGAYAAAIEEKRIDMISKLRTMRESLPPGTKKAKAYLGRLINKLNDPKILRGENLNPDQRGSVTAVAQYIDELVRDTDSMALAGFDDMVRSETEKANLIKNTKAKFAEVKKRLENSKPGETIPPDVLTECVDEMQSEAQTLDSIKNKAVGWDVLGEKIQKTLNRLDDGERAVQEFDKQAKEHEEYDKWLKFHNRDSPVPVNPQTNTAKQAWYLSQVETAKAAAKKARELKPRAILGEDSTPSDRVDFMTDAEQIGKDIDEALRNFKEVGGEHSLYNIKYDPVTGKYSGDNQFNEALETLNKELARAESFPLEMQAESKKVAAQDQAIMQAIGSDQGWKQIVKRMDQQKAERKLQSNLKAIEEKAIAQGQDLSGNDSPAGAEVQVEKNDLVKLMESFFDYAETVPKAPEVLKFTDTGKAKPIEPDESERVGKSKRSAKMTDSETYAWSGKKNQGTLEGGEAKASGQTVLAPVKKVTPSAHDKNALKAAALEEGQTTLTGHARSSGRSKRSDQGPELV